MKALARWSIAFGLTMAVLAGATPASAQPVASAVASQAARTRVDLAQDWRFAFGSFDEAPIKPDFDDSGWKPVTLPHSWNRLGNYEMMRAADSDLRQGTGWYRRTLRFADLPKGRRRFLEFDGVGAVADVWVNGVYVGRHAGAFSRFRLDITAPLKIGDNIVVVRADNSKPAPGSSTADVLPLGGDFFVHGGLYRGVALIEVDAAHIDLLDHGGPGVYISTPAITKDSADVAVLARLRNTGAKARRMVMVTALFDADGVQMARDSAPERLNAGSAVEVRRTLTLPKPRRWNGRADPYRYRAVVELHDGARVIDRVEQQFGVRSFTFDADKGFSLNGAPMRLYGASRHQDMQGRGWALSPEDHARDMAIMAEMGMNSVRHAHYQHAQEWTGEADRVGMVVWAEVPYVHQSSLTDGAPTPALIDNAKAQTIELIRQNFNHPSIMLWSVGNEIDIGQSIKARSGGPAIPARSRDLLKTLDALARAEDPSRITAYADCCEATPLALKGSETLSDVTGLIAYNRYYGWYYGRPDQLRGMLDGFHAKYPGTPIALSEYGAGGAFGQHTDNPLGGPVEAWGRPHPEEFQSWVHEQSWLQLKQTPYLTASWIWNMFDFASTMREEGEAFDLNDKGLVSYDRLRRKDAFYFYKASWSQEPVLYLTGRRYVDRAYPIMDVRAYSNADRATLQMNGATIGTVACPDRICVWPGVRLRPGSNVATLSASFAGQQMNDTATWVAPDAAQGLRIRAGTLTGLTIADGRRFGSDNFFAGGAGVSLNGIVRRSGDAQRIAIGMTSAPELYESYREGDFRYRLPLPPGRWLVRLHMIEPDAAKAGIRSFDVTANGRVVLRAFNPAKAAGGALRAIVREFPVTSHGDPVDLMFTAGTGPALVSALEVIPDGPGKLVLQK